MKKLLVWIAIFFISATLLVLFITKIFLPLFAAGIGAVDREQDGKETNVFSK
jgi:hypothetical protein